jgi:DNA-binding NtrC family response regulator
MEKILVVDDEPFICENLQRILEEEQYRTVIAPRGQTALDLLQEQAIDLVFLDLNLPDISGLEVLKKIKEWSPDLLVIIMTGYASVESAVEALKLGAYDYIKKPFKADVIKLIVKLALETQSLKREVHYLKKQHDGLWGDQTIIAESPLFLEVLNQIQEVAKHPDATVLITGETGTGKELMALSIHHSGLRSHRPFLAINCAALPENLLESELFGYESGAFTGAKGRKIGLFETAIGGTIFLDEMAEMNLGLQSKLLRVLEDKKIRRLGGTQLLEVDFRIIAATNQDLKEAVKKKRFREDLFYRLHMIPIHLPPLRQRPEDVVALTKYFLLEYARKYIRPFKGITDEAQKLLLAYGWPGNVRELRHVIERICIMHNAELLQVSHLPKELTNEFRATDQRSRPFDLPIPPEGINLEEVLDQVAAHLIKKVMHLTDRNISQAAKLLGIPRGTLRYKLEKYED